MQRSTVTWCLLMCVAGHVFGKEPEMPAIDQKQMALYREEAQNFTRSAEAIFKNTTLMESVTADPASGLKASQSQAIQKPTSAILVFVSFSMPIESIESYLRDAKRIGATVVIRGLIDHSFKKTMQTLAATIQKTGYGVELNPLWFKQFSIQAVPEVVVIPLTSSCLQEAQCQSRHFDTVRGNMGLLASLRLIRSHTRIQENYVVLNAAIEKLAKVSHE